MSKLTQASHGKTCIKCDAEGAYSCHYNGPRQQDYGKGRGIKCHDMATAEFCHKCDQEFAEGSRSPVRWQGDFGGKWERSEEFLHWILLTNVRRYNNAVLKLAKRV